MPGQGISGQGGDFTVGGQSIKEVKKWSLNTMIVIHAYSSNKTGGFKRKVTGIKDGKGSIEGVWDPAAPLPSQMEVGQTLAAAALTKAGQQYTYNALFADNKVSVDIDTGDIIGWTSDYEVDGAWTNAA